MVKIHAESPSIKRRFICGEPFATRGYAYGADGSLLPRTCLTNGPGAMIWSV
jgi:hypothetical protein